MKNLKFNSIEKIIADAKKGKMYILVDDENRENEGDLVFSARDVSAEKINFMAKYGRGLICLAIDSNQAKKLNLNYMSPKNESRNQTAFTVSIEAKRGISTGISAKDRATTIKVATKLKVSKTDIVSPGHVFPIVARDGGVLIRAGHTEASVDISRLAKKNVHVLTVLPGTVYTKMTIRINDIRVSSTPHNLITGNNRSIQVSQYKL